MLQLNVKTLVVYDSAYGNTAKIAEAIAEGLGTKALHISKFKIEYLKSLKLLVVGSPIQGWRPLEGMNQWLDAFSGSQLKNIKVTSFDTRMKVFFHGDASLKILGRLVDKGGSKLVDPKVFFVKGKEGPLFDGEMERAVEWGKELGKTL